MPIRIFKRALRWLAGRDQRAVGLYRRLGRPSGLEWAELLRQRRTLYAMGEHCSVQPGAAITDPAHVRMGSNVRLSTCTLLGHDGCVNMINRAYGRRLDRVGKIDIGDDVFIGQGAIVLPDTVIGSRVVIGAGAVVRGVVPPNSVMVGVPARRVGSVDALVAKMEAGMQSYPWKAAIEARGSEFDAASQAELDRLRSDYFFGDAVAAAPRPAPSVITTRTLHRHSAQEVFDFLCARMLAPGAASVESGAFVLRTTDGRRSPLGLLLEGVRDAATLDAGFVPLGGMSAWQLWRWGWRRQAHRALVEAMQQLHDRARRTQDFVADFRLGAFELAAARGLDDAVLDSLPRTDAKCDERQPIAPALGLGFVDSEPIAMPGLHGRVRSATHQGAVAGA